MTIHSTDPPSTENGGRSSGRPSVVPVPFPPEENEWLSRALCPQFPHEWWDRPVGRNARNAKAVCRACPVRLDCQALCDEIEGDDRGHLTMIWAGEKPVERIRRRRACARRAGSG